MMGMEVLRNMQCIKVCYWSVSCSGSSEYLGNCMVFGTNGLVLDLGSSPGAAFLY